MQPLDIVVCFDIDYNPTQGVGRHEFHFTVNDISCNFITGMFSSLLLLITILDEASHGGVVESR